jgi:AAA15 family ATPase/GTPase
MITKLMLKNFRCFQDFTLDGVRPVTLIAGTNNAGYSRNAHCTKHTIAGSK